MTELAIQEKINEYIAKHQELKGKSSKIILSAMVQNGEITEAEYSKLQKQSAFGFGFNKEASIGLAVEQCTTPAQGQAQTTAVHKIELSDEQAKNKIISTIIEDVNSSYTIFQRQDNGIISKGYDSLKNYFDSKLGSSNVEEALALQSTGADNLLKAKDSQLMKKEYYLQNKDHLKKMLIRRLYKKDENSGIDFLDKNRGKQSKEEFAKFLENYIQKMIDEVPSLDSLKSIKHQLVTSTPSQTEENLQKLLKNAHNQKPQALIEGQLNIRGTGIPLEFDSDEPIKFEEVFKYERGCDYNKEKVENYIDSKAEIGFATGKFNKYQQFKTASDEYLNDYAAATKIYTDIDGNSGGETEPSPDIQAKKVVDLFQNYFANPINPNLAKEKLQNLITKNNLPIQLKTDEKGEISLDLNAYNSAYAKNKDLNNLIKLEAQEQSATLEKVLGGKVEDKMLAHSQNFENAHNSAFGNDFTEELVQAMENDNKTAIQRYTGGTSTAGMALTVLGGILCFTPAAPIGGIAITAGNTLAVGGIAAESSLGFTEAFTRNNVDGEEVKDLTKTALMNAGGFIVGMGAGKLGMKAFNKLIDTKLAETFKMEIIKGNKAAALKEVFTNPEKLINFMKSAGTKLGADFLISYAGDLAMMGVLGTNDDWQSLLKANLMGIVVGTSSEIGGLGKLGIKKGGKPEFLDKEITPAPDKNLLEGVLRPNELTKIAPFAKRLTKEHSPINDINSIYKDNQIIKDLEKNLTNKIANNENPAEAELVREILDRVSNRNIGIINKMLKDNTVNNSQILSTLKALTKTVDLNNPIIPEANIKDSSLKIKYAEKLLDNKNVPKKLVPGIIRNLNEKNSVLLNALMQDSSIDVTLITPILRSTIIIGMNGISTHNRDVKLALELVSNKDFPKEHIANIIPKIGSINLKLAKELCNSPDFPKSEIAEILNNTIFSNGKYNWESTISFKTKIAQQLARDVNCPKEEIADIVKVIEKKQEPLFEKLYADNNIPKQEIAGILTLQYGIDKGIKKLSFFEKVDCLTNSLKIENNTLNYLKKYGFNKNEIEKLVKEISLEMGLKKTNLKTENQNLLFKGFLANNNPKIENSIKNINLDNCKDGIPLKYTRQSFIADLQEILKNTGEAEKKSILHHFGIDIDKNEFEGLTILPDDTNTKFDEKTLPVVNAIKEKIKDFALNNEVKTDNPELKAVFDDLIKGFPEFTTIIGKKQHGTHAYSTDIHTLKVLQNAMKNPTYNELSDQSKTILKISILMHDIGKKGGTVDPKHFETSAKYAINMLEKFKIPENIKSSIVEIIYNHHWFEKYNTNNISPKFANALFRSPEELKIAMIMAKADFQSVNNNFHLSKTKTKTEEAFDNYMQYKFEPIQRYSKELLSKSNIILDTKFKQTEERHFPTQRVNVKGKYKNIPVLNLTDNNIDNNLYKYGFAYDTTKDNARFMVHMNDKMPGLEVFIALSSSPSTHSVQSLSLISKENNRTYKKQIYGIITDVDQKNISDASYENLASGKRKDIKSFATELFSGSESRTFVKNNLVKNLKESGIDLSDAEYAQLTEKLIKRQYSSQIKQDIQIGNKIIKPNILKNALESARDELFNGNYHSEIVAINPRVKALIARVSSIDECSHDFLEMAAKHNLPIILIGYKEPI